MVFGNSSRNLYISFGLNRQQLQPLHRLVHLGVGEVQVNSIGLRCIILRHSQRGGDPVVVDHWFRQIEKILEAMEIISYVTKIRLAAFQLEGES